MPVPRPPSRIEPLSFPVFGISWWSEPAENGRSIFAYCGGGGAAKTGVNNSVVVFGEKAGPRQISTDSKVGVCLKLYQNPVSGKLWMMVGLGSSIRRYAVDAQKETGDENDEDFDNDIDDDDFGELELGDGESCLVVAANSMADRVAFGCESGKILVFATSDDTFIASREPLYVLEGHKNAICALDFASRTVGRLISSAKDGTACIWLDNRMVGGLRCSVPPDPKQPKPKRTPQILVRGCAFGDLEGKVCYTVASARRGKAYLAQWQQQQDEAGKLRFVCVAKDACSDCPISAMSISMDQSLLVLGSVEGDIIFWNLETWAPIKVFREVHHLPVTCIAARPFYTIPGLLQGEDEKGVMVHARSASADSQLGCLTLQRRAFKKPKQPGEGGDSSCFTCSNLMLWIHRLLVLYILSLMLSPVYHEAQRKCGHVWKHKGAAELGECLLHDVLIAPSSRPGVSTAIY